MKTDLLYQNFVPLSRIVSAAILDMYEDKGKSEQVYTHWAARGLFEVDMHILKGNKRSVLLPVSANTKTAALPLDFNGAVFVGYINNQGFKVPLKANTNLVSVNDIEEIPCNNPCSKCHSDKDICAEMQVSVDTKIVEIEGVNYEQTITKKLYPNGDYFLESSIPYLGIEQSTNSVSRIDFTDVGDDGDTVEIQVNDTVYGWISLGIYTKTSSDINVNILAENIARMSNNYGYILTSENGTVIVQAREGLGANMNGDNMRVIFGEPPIDPPVSRKFNNKFNTKFK